MIALYCPLSSRSCQTVNCDEASEFLSTVDCVCLTQQELEHIHDKIANNADQIKELWKDQYQQILKIHEQFSPKFADLQKWINDSHIKISDANNRIDNMGLVLGTTVKDLDNLKDYTKNFIKPIVDNHSKWIYTLNSDIFGNASDIGDLKFQMSEMQSDLTRIYQLIFGNKNNIDQIFSTLYGQGIYIDGITDIEIPDFGGGITGGEDGGGQCEGCAKKNETNIFTGDNVFTGDIEIHDRDLQIRHKYDKGNFPPKDDNLSVQFKDREGNVTSDNISALVSTIQPDGTVTMSMRAYRYVGGSIAHCDILLHTPPVGESYVELSNLIVGTQYNEYQCGTGKIEAWDKIHGHTDLEIDKNTHLHGTLEVDKDSSLHGNLTVDKNTHVKGELEVNKDSKLHGNLTVDKNTHVKGELEVNGDSKLHGNLKVDKNVTIDGSTDIKGSTHIYNKFEVDGTSHFHQNSYYDKNIYVKGEVGSNTEGAITTPGGILMGAKGYYCGSKTAQNLFEIHNGKKYGNTISGPHEINSNACFTALLHGALRIAGQTGPNSYGGALSVKGHAFVDDNLYIGNMRSSIGPIRNMTSDNRVYDTKGLYYYDRIKSPSGGFSFLGNDSEKDGEWNIVPWLLSGGLAFINPSDNPQGNYNVPEWATFGAAINLGEHMLVMLLAHDESGGSDRYERTFDLGKFAFKSVNDYFVFFTVSGMGDAPNNSGQVPSAKKNSGSSFTIGYDFYGADILVIGWHQRDYNWDVDPNYNWGVE